jgi:hypothetical protein
MTVSGRPRQKEKKITFKIIVSWGEIGLEQFGGGLKRHLKLCHWCLMPLRALKFKWPQLQEELNPWVVGRCEGLPAGGRWGANTGGPGLPTGTPHI